jgi:hypothetical protein
LWSSASWFPDLRIQQAIIRQRRIALVLVWSCFWQHQQSQISVEISFLVYALGLLLVSVFMVVHSGGAGLWIALSDCPNRFAYANEAVLPFYILHQPVILISDISSSRCRYLSWLNI